MLLPRKVETVISFDRKIAIRENIEIPRRYYLTIEDDMAALTSIIFMIKMQRAKKACRTYLIEKVCWEAYKLPLSGEDQIKT